MRDKPTGQTIVFTSNLISILQNREFISQIYSKTIGFGETQVNLTEGSIPYDVVSVDLQIIQWGNNPFAFIQNVTNATFVSVDLNRFGIIISRLVEKFENLWIFNGY